MLTDKKTLMKLLADLHDELKKCMGNSTIAGAADPIMLGDFIVDAYNAYLAGAKALYEDPTIQNMAEVERTAMSVNTEEYRSASKHASKHGMDRIGHDPRVLKLHELSFKSKQLLVLLEGMSSAEDIVKESQVSAVIALLDGLLTQIQDVQRSLDETQEGNAETTQGLIREYHRCLEVVTVDGDTVLINTFQPLDEYVTDDIVACRSKLTEVRVAASGLLTYLSKAQERGR